jgi:N-acetylmuramoyl-L-alanine amidase
MSEKQKKLLLALCLLFAVNMLTIVLVGRVHADLYKRGASGATVSEIQKRLKAWGYYDGSVDGVYGSRTEAAVRWFQRRNGLSVDGQVGDQTLAALGIRLPAAQKAAATAATSICLRASSPPKRAASPTPGRSRSARWCSTACGTPPSRTRSPA